MWRSAKLNELANGSMGQGEVFKNIVRRSVGDAGDEWMEREDEKRRVCC